MYPRIIKAATEREDKIEAGLKAAAEAEERLANVQAQVEQKLDEARAQAREILNRAHQRGDRRRCRGARQGAGRTRRRIVERARTEIGAERDRAIQDLRAEVSQPGGRGDAAECSGSAIDDKTHQRLIDEALQKVGDNPGVEGGAELTMERASILARRYAEAYFALAQDANDIAGWREQLAGVVEVLGDSARSAMRSPIRRRVSPSGCAMGMKLLDGASPEARNLARLLIERRRVGIVSEILTHYDALADKASGVVRAEVITAVPVDKALEKHIRESLSKQLGSDVRDHRAHGPIDPRRARDPHRRPGHRRQPAHPSCSNSRQRLPERE